MEGQPTQCCGFGDRGVAHFDPVAGAGTANLTSAGAGAIVPAKPKVAKRKIGDVGRPPQRGPVGSSGSRACRVSKVG